MLGLPKNFMHFLTLKQGTLLTAKVHLIVAGYTIIFFYMGLSHISGIEVMIVRDTEDALEREALEEITSKCLNSQKMELAHKKAIDELYSMYFMLVMTVIHFINSILLLYAALMNNRCLMTPWMMTMMTIIVSLIISVFIARDDYPLNALVGGQADFCDRLLVIASVAVCIYMWLVVYSLYNSLVVKKGIIHEVHDPQIKYVNLFITTRKKKVDDRKAMPEPYDV